MADQFATPADLASALQQDVDTATATLLLEGAAAVVQQAADGQRILQVVGDTATVLGNSDSWLDLPQIPVTTVTSVTLDGVLLTTGTDYKVVGNRLWRRQGWQTSFGWPWDLSGIGAPWYTYAPPSLMWPFQEPSAVVVVYTHGYPPGAQQLQLARSACLSLAAGTYSNPSAAQSEHIDDYSVAFDQMAAHMEATPHLKAALRKQYGRRAGLVRIG
jgi:hypothetical protein